MKPCDCQDEYSVRRFLSESGISYNEWSLTVTPATVRIENRSCMMKIPMVYFKRFAEWYLEDQEEKEQP